MSDEKLVVLSLANEDDFLFLMKRYEEKLLKYIFKISGLGQDEAEDVLQEVFIKVFKNLNDFDPEMKFSSWIYRITRNQTISHFRKNKNFYSYLSSEENENLLSKLEGETDLAKELDKKILKDRVAEFLPQLDYKYREVLVLRFLEEKDYKEIAQIIKKPIGTVATLISRAKKSFLAEAQKTNLKF